MGLLVFNVVDCHFVSLLWLVDFSALSVFDAKTILVLVLGTAILTAADRLGGQPTRTSAAGQLKLLIPIIRKSLMVTGYAASLLLLFFGLKTQNSDALRGLVEAGRPLMYAFLLAQLMDLFLKPSQENHTDQTNEGLIPTEILNQRVEQPQANRKNAEEVFRMILLSSGLSAREVEIAELVAQGRTNAEIAELLFISPVDLPSIILLLGLLLPLLAASGLMKDFLRVFRIVKSKSAVFTMTELKKSLLAVRLTLKLLLGSGVFGTLTGAIFILAQTAEISSIPAAFSVSGIILLYAILLWLILLPLQSHLEARLLEIEGK